MILHLPSDEKILESHVQTNSSESDGAKFKSESILSYTFAQSHLAGKLYCIIKHPAYQSDQKKMVANLDVLCKISCVKYQILILLFRQAICDH